MRAWLLTAVVLAGCLHSPVPKPVMKDVVAQEWQAHMRAGRYEKAAETAWRGKLGKTYIGLALERARDFAQLQLDAYEQAAVPDQDALELKVLQAYKTEAVIACTYGPHFPASGEMAIEDVLKAYSSRYNEEFRYLLLDVHCPVDNRTRDEIIDAARTHREDERLLRYAVEARWSQAQRIALVEYLFKPTSECDRAMRAVAVLHPPMDTVVAAIGTARCETGTFHPDGWQLSPQDARVYFDAAVQTDSHDFTFELLKIAGLGDTGLNALFARMLKGHWEYRLADFLKRHPETYDKALVYALAHDELRAVGHFAKTGDWVRKAVARAIELQRYEEATLIAETGCDEAFRKEGPVLAFKAALDAKEFPMAHRLAKRNRDLIDKEDARKAADGYYAWLATQPLPAPVPRKHKTIVLPKCKEDWDAKRPRCQK